jgi:predicted nucleotidyltransferase
LRIRATIAYVNFLSHKIFTHFSCKRLKQSGNFMGSVTKRPEHQELKEIVAGCVTRHHSHHYLGFAATQWDLFQKDEPPRVKPLLYVYRVLLTGIHLMRTGKVEANLVTLNEVLRLPYVPELVERKIRGAEKGTFALPEIAFHKGEYERLTAQLEAAANDSHLPNEPGCRDALNDLLVRIRLRTPAYSRGSTGSLSSASTPNTHS